MLVSDINNCRIIELPKISDHTRGSLSVAEQLKEIPFTIKRAYWTYDVPAGECRGGHAHKTLTELIVAISGSFRIIITDGKVKKEFLLNHPWEGLLITPGIWRTLEDFSSGTVCMVLASELYDEDDYIRDYETYLKNVL